MAAAALLASTAVGVSDFDYGEGGFRRCRTDQTAAIASFLERAYPRSLPGLGGAAWDPAIDSYYHEVLASRVRAQGLQPWQPWRTVPARPFLRATGPTEVPYYDDPGRAWLLGLGFRALGGVAPFLIVWLAPLLAALVLGWAVAEATAAGHAPAALVFALLLAASPFVIETLALTRSSVGFHLVALLLVVALAFAAGRRPAPGWRAWLARVLAAGAVFATCTLCRSGAALMLPAFLVVLAVGCARAGGRPLPRRHRAAAGLIALALFVGPYLLARAPQRHSVWAGFWEGLGDYDRTKGHVWSDRAAAERVWRASSHKRPMPRPGGDVLVEWIARPEADAVFREDVLGHVASDPAWYAGILARRAFATLTLQRLWPWGPRDGRSMDERRATSGGNLDKYWSYTSTADWLGLGPWRVELPVGVLLLPTAALLALALGRRLGGLVEVPALFVLGALGLAASTLPVVVTTASGSEPQAIVLAFYLGAALLAQAAWRRWRAARDARP